MRDIITSLLVAGCVSSTAVAFQAGSGGAAAGAVCPLLSRDLVMKVSTAAGRSALERAKPVEDWVGQASREAGVPVAPGVSSCEYGRILLVLNPLARPEQVRDAMHARTPPYKEYEPVDGVGDAAFFDANSAYANLCLDRLPSFPYRNGRGIRRRCRGAETKHHRTRQRHRSPAAMSHDDR